MGTVLCYIHTVQTNIGQGQHHVGYISPVTVVGLMSARGDLHVVKGKRYRTSENRVQSAKMPAVTGNDAG